MNSFCVCIDFFSPYIDIPGDYENCTTTKISFNRSTKNLLPYLSKLKNLIINSIYFDKENLRESLTSTKTNLKLIQIWIDEKDDEIEKRKFLENYFMNISQPTIIKIIYINNENVLKKKL